MTSPISSNLKSVIDKLARHMSQYVFGNDSGNLSELFTNMSTEIINSGGGGIDWQESVKDKDLVTSPALPAAGDRYLIAGTGGTWAGFTINDIVQYDGSAWMNWHPTEGFMVEVEDENLLYYYNGTSWEVYTPSLPFYDVTKYGLQDVIGFDNSPAFTALLAAIPAYTPCTIYFPPALGAANYEFASQVAANLTNKNIILMGGGDYSYIEFTTDTSFGWNFTGGTLIIKNFYIAVPPVITSTGIALGLTSCANILVENIRFNTPSGADCYPVKLTSCSGIINNIDPGNVSSTAAGIWLSSCSNIKSMNFSYQQMGAASGKGVWIDRCSRVEILNMFGGAGAVGAGNNYDIYSSSSNNVLIDNYNCNGSSGVWNGIYIDGGFNIFINNTSFSATSAWDINTVGNPDNVCISDYKSTKAGVTGISGTHTIIGDGYDTPTRLPFVKGITNRDADIVSGIGGVKAIGRLSLTGVATIADTLTINGQIHTFVTTIPTLPNTLRTSTTTAANQAARIASYFNSLSTQNVNVVAVYTSPNTYVDFVAKVPGAAGNLIGFTELMANATADGGDFLGGTVFGVDPIDTFSVDDVTGDIHSHGDITCASINPSNLPVYDVTNYGLVADYAGGGAHTDNSAAFAALLALIPTYTPCIIYFPTSAGILDYGFDSTITANLSHKIITFMGSNTEGGGSYPGFLDPLGTGWDFTNGIIDFKNFTVYGNVNVAGAAALALRYMNLSDPSGSLLFDGLVVKGSADICLLLEACKKIMIQGGGFQTSLTSASGAALIIRQCTSVYVEGVQCSGGGKGILIDKTSTDITLKDCATIPYMGDYGIYMYQAVSDIVLDGVYCLKNGTGEGIFVDGSCAGVVIDKPKFGSPTLGSLTTWDINISGKPYNVQIRNYKSTKVGYTGINNIASATIVGDDYQTPAKFPFVAGIINRGADIVSGIAGTKAVGTLTFTGVSILGETITIDGQAHVFTSDAVATWLPNTIRAGTSTSNSAARCAAYFNYNSTKAGLVEAIASGNTVIFTAKVPGVLACGFSQACTNATMDGGGFFGGTVAGVDPIDTFSVDDVTGNISTIGTVDGVDVSVLATKIGTYRNLNVVNEVTTSADRNVAGLASALAFAIDLRAKIDIHKMSIGAGAHAAADPYSWAYLDKVATVNGTALGIITVADPTGFSVDDVVFIDNTIHIPYAAGYIADIGTSAPGELHITAAAGGAGGDVDLSAYTVALGAHIWNSCNQKLANPTDLASLIAFMGYMKAGYILHDDDAELGAAWNYHIAQEAGDHSINAALPMTNLTEMIAMLVDFHAAYDAHVADLTAHTAAVGGTVVADPAMGAAITIVDAAAAIGDKIHWSILNDGAGASKGVSAVAGTGIITFTFDADPLSDTVLSYSLFRAN